MTFYFLGATVSKKSQFIIFAKLIYFVQIDDTVAGDADTTKLMDLGLVYGDIISYRQLFPSNSTPKRGIVQRKSIRVKNEDPENPFRTNWRDETTDSY